MKYKFNFITNNNLLKNPVKHNNKISKRLIKIRKLMGLSQQDLANILDYPQDLIQKYEEGTKEIPFHYLVMLHWEFNIDINNLI